MMNKALYALLCVAALIVGLFNGILFGIGEG